MRFLFWTFLDILKMSIFGFLKEMFFRHTEKSGKIKTFYLRIENGKEIIKSKNVFLIFLENDSFKLDILKMLRRLALTTYEACLFFVLALKIVRI